ncbi:hypothetical protein [Pseudoflavitalea rhizosphaerae]|uniref:hypothetical protein n=1 Tax=Pseudoflavitalea rhizosphaerae TaxID=1884793 RepID=UPI000F8CD1EB|nr:hypothetical protein [Pseudoflavitalea rhizosphaerae]
MKLLKIILIFVLIDLPIFLFSGDTRDEVRIDCLYWFEVNHGISTTVIPIAIVYLYPIPDSNGNGWPDEAMFPGTPPYSCEGETYICALGYQSASEIERVYVNGLYWFRPTYGATSSCVVWRDF